MLRIPLHSAQAVSYTHLDVYKRQGLYLIVAGHLHKNEKDPDFLLAVSGFFAKVQS